MLVAQTKWEDGAKRAQTLQWAIETTPCDFRGTVLPVKVSLGTEPYGPDDLADELIRRADMAMYYVTWRCTMLNETKKARLAGLRWNSGF
jgi:GGDEF domain-containing protein